MVYFAAMFSLFVCITQDGWVDIKKELRSCASAVVGEIYLIIFITIGAFILINLVVAVVVNNLVMLTNLVMVINQVISF